MSANAETPEASPQSSVETENNELCTDLQRSDWDFQPHVLDDRADVRYTDRGWTSASGTAVERPELNVSSARTTFYVKYVEPRFQSRSRWRLFNRMWRRQWNRGQKEIGDNNLVRRQAKLLRCDTILQQCEVREVARRFSLRQVQTQDLRGYSRHYSGADGACVGFAVYRMYSDKQDAMESYVARRAVDTLPGLDKDSIDNLVDYTFRRQSDE